MSQKRRVATVMVALLNYNRGSRAVESIRSVFSGTFDPERLTVVLLDNASTDDSIELVAGEFGSDVQIWTSRVNIGPVLRNRAILSNSTDYVIMLDEDCRPESDDMISRAVEFMESHTEYGALCFACRNAHTGQREFGHPGTAFSRMVDDNLFEGVYVIGGGMMFRSSAMAATTGYDERLGFGGEEYDLAMEMIRHGVKIAFRKDLVILHDQAPRSTTPVRSWELDMRNNIWISLGRFPLALAPVVATLHVLRRLISGASARNTMQLRGYLRGVRTGLRSGLKFVRTRRPVPVARLFEYRHWAAQMFVGRPLFTARAARQRSNVPTVSPQKEGEG